MSPVALLPPSDSSAHAAPETAAIDTGSSAYGDINNRLGGTDP